ncbi:MAG: hypothetical protein ACP5OA_01595 [Candidatus Woesearchaeota archaeon]
MVDHKRTPNNVKVGGSLFEELAFGYLEKKYNISKKELLSIIEKKQSKEDTIPVSILRSSKLSSLESIVKFLRENRKVSYHNIGKFLDRNPKTLAVSYRIACQKMPEAFDNSVDDDKERIPFTAFTKELSILECICVYLKSSGNSYAQISRMINKDQRTVWTICKRAERKSGEESKVTHGK